MNHPFTDIVKSENFNPSAPFGFEVKDKSIAEDGGENKQYLDDARTLFRNPTFKAEVDSCLQGILAGMSKENFEICETASNIIKAFYSRFESLAQRANDLEARDREVQDVQRDPVQVDELEPPSI